MARCTSLVEIGRKLAANIWPDEQKLDARLVGMDEKMTKKRRKKGSYANIY